MAPGNRGNRGRAPMRTLIVKRIEEDSWFSNQAPKLISEAQGRTRYLDPTVLIRSGGLSLLYWQSPDL